MKKKLVKIGHEAAKKAKQNTIERRIPAFCNTFLKHKLYSNFQTIVMCIKVYGNESHGIFFFIKFY